MIQFIRPLGRAVRLALACCMLLAAAQSARAQYSTEAATVRAAQELYDERGYAQSGVVTTDGRLIVSNSNGNVSYSYPILNTSVSGYPLSVSLNYCGSVQFSTYRTYQDGYAYLFSHWARFSENRPAWLLGCNGWCVGMISSNSSYICDPSKYANGQDTTRSTFDDHDAVWLADGYDACNRMGDFADANDPEPTFTDRIQLLRSDGSVCTLLHTSEKNGGVPIESRSTLYVGYYYEAQANSRAYAVVTFDSTGWLPAARDLVNSVVAPGERWRFMPRILKYYDGSGVEAVFREWTTPYGMQAYAGRGLAVPTRYGAMTAGPTVFYLEQINSNSGALIWDIKRTRQYYPHQVATPNNGNIYDPIFTDVIDSTPGRALVTDIGDVHIDYSDNALTVQALGRTTRVRYPKAQPSGRATSTTSLPIASRGYFTQTAEALGHLLPEAIANTALYESSLGYVTDIIDPEGRTTHFEYEPYSRTYRNFNFPVANRTNATINFTANNLRLNRVVEPTASYRISYAGGNWIFNGNWLQEDTVRSAVLLPYGAPGTDSLNYPYLHTNVASVVRKYDAGGSLLTEQRNTYYHDGTAFYRSEARSIDTVTHRRHATTTDYVYHPLPDSLRRLPPNRFTEVTKVTDSSEVVSSSDTRTEQQAISPYIWLPTRDSVVVAGVVRSKHVHEYQFDTARTYGGDARLTSLFGPEVKRSVTTTIDPGTGAAWLRDTSEFIDLRLIDTTLTRLDTLLDKFATLANYRAAIDSGTISGPWEDWMRNPRVMVFHLDSTAERMSLPPCYGMLRRHVTADASGAILGGQEYVFAGENVAPHYLNDLLYRGTLDTTYDIGAGGVRRFRSASVHSRTNGLNLPVIETEANGAYRQYYYESYSSPKLRRAGGAYAAVGSILRDDGTKRDTTLPHDGYFSVAFNKPLVEHSVVRRYAGDTLAYDTLLAINQYGYYGLLASEIDANGNYARYDHDRNGRLLTMWSPGDFARRDSIDTMRYSSRERIGIVGFTRHRFTADTVRCDSNGIIHGGPQLTEDLPDLYAAHTASVIPDCPCPPANPETKRHGATPLQSCTVHLPYTGNDYHDGYLQYTVDSASALLNADVPDSAYLELHPMQITGECVTLTVAIDQFGFAKSYVFNCGENPLGTGRAQEKGGGRSPLGAGDDPTGFTLKVDLMPVKSQLLALHAGAQLTVRLSVSTAGGTISFVDGVDAEDTRPALVLKGTFKRPTETADYTLAYTYADDSLTATATAKLDDIRHTANQYDLAATHGAVIRRTAATSTYGADGRIIRTITPFTGHGAARTDTLAYTYTGGGERLRTRDRSGDTAVVEYDGAARPVKSINGDGTFSTTTYRQGLPSAFGLSDSAYHGYCEITTTRNEDGVTYTHCTDAFGLLRRSVADTNGLKLATTYEYDVQGRLAQAVSPKGDTTRYAYDAWGNVRYKQQPDLGAISFAYDALGNARFTQTQAQANNHELSFTEYDDLNRVTLIGEAFLANADCGTYNEDALDWFCGPITAAHRDDGGQPGGTKHAGRHMQGWSDALASRETNLDATTLHTGAVASILTANRTLWNAPVRTVPTFAPTNTFAITGCTFPPLASLGETDSARGPMIVHPAQFYTSTDLPGASPDDFENVATYPEFVRTAVAYDTLPAQRGAVWSAFPPLAKWNALAPTGVLRNLKGREAAVAWRERGSEPFHYAVCSYDERGRLEALLRYTEDLGYDAVYYTYNSANQITSVAVADPLRQYTTWYGTGGDAKVDSIWTSLGASGTGLINNGNVNQWRYPAPLARPAVADIVYRYTKSGAVDSMSYPPANVLVRFAYNHMKGLDSLVATHGGADLFREALTYDPAGQITGQTYAHSGGARQRQLYSYDSVQRLTQYTQGPAPGGIGITAATGYRYDAGGNRLEANNGMTAYDTYSYTPGTNRLAGHLLSPGFVNPTRTAYTYDGDGATSERARYEVKNGTDVPLSDERYRYSYRHLMKRANIWRSATGTEDWQYRYSAGGEREEKRLYSAAQTDSVSAYAWVYYLLGGGSQLAVYHGQQISGAAGCGGTGRRVNIYPTEYLTNGVGWNGVREDITQVVTKPNGVKEYQVSDHLASLRVAVEGTAERHVDYDPWGNVLGGSGGVVAGERQGFNNQEADRETGLYDLSDRRYDPETGHFPSPDRLWETDRATSPYAYCEDNPVRLTDPTGMQAAPESGPALQAPPVFQSDGKESVLAGVGKDIVNNFASATFDVYILPLAPTLRLMVEPAKTIGGYVETFKNATGQNGGKSAARFWLTKAAEVVIYGGLSEMAAGVRTPAPAAEPAAPAEAAAQKTAPAAPAEAPVTSGGAERVGPSVGGGAKLENLTREQISRIQTVADKRGLKITVVGSRARGIANAASDWDYIIEGGNARARQSALYELPKNPNANKAGDMRPGSETLKGVAVDPKLPHITFTPRGR
ncbi:MAG: RHS repeat-associated core domain-containing protein [Bacteroidetes bacterium]|nr:RHS repeat-associated core domain-containing protein [Bacteroidota bacterium]